MARVLTFSRFYPAYHPKAGQPTHFVEKFWRSILDNPQFSSAYLTPYEQQYQKHFPLQFKKEENVFSHAPKHHTIRAGERWKEGDIFSPRVWSGKPYNSPQIIIGPDMPFKKVWGFRLRDNGKHLEVYINGKEWGAAECGKLDNLMINDGLTETDFKGWFTRSPEFKRRRQFTGQILCWNENINY